MENSRQIHQGFKMAIKYDIFRRSINIRSGTCTTKNRAMARYYWRSFRITARNPSSKRYPRVIRRSCRRASSDLSGFASGYCGSLIYDEGAMRKEFL